jgi:hypothetical protein
VKLSVAVVVATADELEDERVGGALAGVVLKEATDGAEVPATEFRATAVNVYATPGVKPSTKQLVFGANTVQVNPPGEEVIV